MAKDSKERLTKELYWFVTGQHANENNEDFSIDPDHVWESLTLLVEGNVITRENFGGFPGVLTQKDVEDLEE